MIPPKYNATKDLFQALIRAKRAFGRTSDSEPAPPMTRAPSDEASACRRGDGPTDDED